MYNPLVFNAFTLLFQLLMNLKGKFAMHVASEVGNIGILKEMFKTASTEALMEIEDSEMITPLLAAVRGLVGLSGHH